MFLRNWSISSFPALERSILPISTKRPNEAQHLHVAWSWSPVRELIITSTPRPDVAWRMPSRKEVSRELKMLEGLRPKVSTRYFFFSSVETVVNIYLKLVNGGYAMGNI